MGSRAGKGSSFEREVCKKLSLWWTTGQDDDVFWRTSGSGARAKTRSKKNKTTFGQCGDIQATNPIGQPLIDLCSIELKRGYSKATFADLLDRSPEAKEQVYEEFVLQAELDSTNAQAKSWMLIVKRDRRQALLFIPFELYKHLRRAGCLFESCYVSAFVRFLDKKGVERTLFIGHLDRFLSIVQPHHIQEVLEQWD